MSTSILLVANPFQITLSFLIMGFFLSIFLVSCLLWLQTLPPALTEHSLAANQTCCLGSQKCSQLWLKGPTGKFMQFDIFCGWNACLTMELLQPFFLCCCWDGYKLCKFTELINEFSHYSCNSLSSSVCNYSLHSLSHTRLTLFQCSSAVQSALASRERSVPELIGFVLLSSLSVSKEAIRVIFWKHVHAIQHMPVQ